MAISEKDLELQREAQRLRKLGEPISQELADAEARIAKYAAEALVSEEARAKALQRSLDKLQETIELNEKLEELGLRRSTWVEAIYDKEEAYLKLLDEELKAYKKSAEYTDEEYKKRLETLALAKDELEARKDSLDYTENLITRFTGITDQPKSGLAKMFANPDGFSKGFSDATVKMINPMNIMTSTIDKVVETTIALAVEQDQAVVNFRTATGASGEFDNNIRGLEVSLRQAGVSAAEAGQAVQSLYLNVTDFTVMSEANQAVLGETVAVLNELGVSAETTAKNMQFAIKILGQSEKQAARLQRELFTFAQELGVSADQMASDFASMGPQIAALGSNGVDAFKKLEVQAKNTGLALSEILGLVEKFDKFDSAAESVGKLNALLGGPYLNTLELVAETDPSKRFEILKDRIDDAGLSFDQMDYYQRKALASAVGLNEQQLALMMRGRLDLIQEPQKSAAEIEALAQQTAQFNTVLDELTQIGMALAVSLGPFVSFLKNFLQLASPVIKQMDVLVVAIGIMKTQFYLLGIAADGSLGILGRLVGIVMTLAYVFFVRAASPGLITILGLAAGAFTAMGMAASFFGFSLGPVLPFVLSFAAAILMLGTGIGVAAAGLSLMVTSLSDFGTGLADSMLTTAMAIKSIVEDVNNLDTVKTVALGGVMVATAAAAPAAALAAAVGGGAAATGAPAIAGPPPVINVKLSIDGTEFSTVVNSVEVEKYTGGEPSSMYSSIVDMIEQGFVKGV